MGLKSLQISSENWKRPSADQQFRLRTVDYNITQEYLNSIGPDFFIFPCYISLGLSLSPWFCDSDDMTQK